jgi:hypothetical protein
MICAPYAKKTSRDFMQNPRAWAVDVGRTNGETKSKREGFFCRETEFLNYDLVSCEGYSKNGALASLGLGGGSGAYYGSVGECYVSSVPLGRDYRMFLILSLT